MVELLDRFRKLISTKVFRVALTGLSLLIIFVVYFTLVQFSTPNLPGNDGYYHIKFAQIMRAESLTPDFPWLPLTILNPREFYDHHFLFHIGLIPFTFGDLRTGAKLASILFASLSFLSAWWLLREQRVPFAALWALGLLTLSEAFIYRMSIPRAQSLSLLVLIWGLNWMLKRRYLYLLPLGFFYVWLYNAFPLLLVIAVIYVAAQWLIERRLDFRPVLYTGLGIGMGMLINPYFPHNVVFAYRHILPKLANATEVRVGNEWYPYTTGQLMQNSVVTLVSFASGVLALGLNPRRMDLRTAVVLFISLVFGVMLFQSRRFIEYFPPFVLIFTAFSWASLISDFLESGRLPLASHNKQTSRTRSSFVFLLLLMGVLVGMRWTFQAAQESVVDSKPYDLYAEVSNWLHNNTPTGTRVFQTDWDDFTRLFYYNTENTYLVGLDPTYMQIYNPELYETWVEISSGEIERPSNLINDLFASEYVMTDLGHTKFLLQASEDPGLLEVFRDEQAVVFRVLK